MTDTTTDFNYELKTVEFPFKEILIGNEVYRDALFSDFESLTPKPKLHYYWSEFISTEQWETAHGNQNHDGRNSYKKDGNGDVKYIYKDDFARLEAQSGEIYNEFNVLLVKNSVDKKYYGRFVNDTETIKILNDINNKIETFNRYIFAPSSIDTFEGYATATAFKIISLLDKINVHGLKHDIITSFVNNSENIHVTIAYLNNSEPEQKELKRKYDILKTYVDKVFNEEISRISRSTITKGLSIKKEKDIEIQNAFNENGFTEFIINKGYLPENIFHLLSENELPYIIALLSEVGYLDYFKKEHCKSIGAIGDRNKKLKDILKVNEENVKKLILSMSPDSKIDRLKYNAPAYTKEVQQTLNSIRGEST